MDVQLATYLRTTLPLNLASLENADSGRYHSVWMPDHMVSFWPDSIWTPEFTDLATVSHSPHRHLDSLTVAGAVAALTKNVPIATSVVDTVRRHPSMLAQTALTLDHLSKGRFILGLGSGELENTVPYGFDFSKSVSRFEEALKVIRLLWDTDGPVDFEGQFYHLHHARMDTEPYEGRTPKIWVGCGGPRMLEITGRYADGWWAMGLKSPEDYAAKLKVVRDSAQRAGRDPMAITPANISVALIAYDDAELAEILNAPIIKSWALMIPADAMRSVGYEHPMGEKWGGVIDFDPHVLTRERVVDCITKVNVDALRKLLPSGTPQQVARKMKSYVDAGLRVPTILDYASMAGLKFMERSAKKVRDVEDELMRLVKGV
jgi:phthiodiolone/phenolphthiodiolone dimycocerosates ketoreductase